MHTCVLPTEFFILSADTAHHCLFLSPLQLLGGESLRDRLDVVQRHAFERALAVLVHEQQQGGGQPDLRRPGSARMVQIKFDGI